MKKLILTMTFLIISTLKADINTNTFGSEEITEYTAQDNKVFSLKFSAELVGRARFDERLIDDEHFSYHQADVEGSVVFYHNPCYAEGALLTLGYDFTRLNWRENPFFLQKDFNTISLSLGFFSERLPNWLWTAEAAINVSADHFNINSYAYYDLLAWGRYAYTPCIGFHVGILAETGMKIDHVYPIIGIDWLINDTWKLNLVYPVNISVVYTFNDQFNFALAGRFFDKRARVGKSEPLSEGLWNYRATGIELGVNYIQCNWLTANLHVGYTFGGILKIANEDYRDRIRLKFEPSPYLGGEIVTRF